MWVRCNAELITYEHLSCDVCQKKNKKSRILDIKLILSEECIQRYRSIHFYNIILDDVTSEIKSC